jgi:hypothetical protein
VVEYAVAICTTMPHAARLCQLSVTIETRVRLYDGLSRTTKALTLWMTAHIKGLSRCSPIPYATQRHHFARITESASRESGERMQKVAANSM